MSLFPEPPQREVSQRYRTWAYESAALDLALRQAGIPLHEALGRSPQPVRFVVSLRLGEPPTLEPLESRLRRYPGLRFKLDPTSSWDERLIGELVATGAVDSVDFKGYYSGSIVDQPADPVLYRRVAEAFPRRLDRGSGAHRGDRRGARGPPRALLLGRPDPLDRGHRSAALPAEDGQHQALPAGGPAQPARRLRLLRASGESATTAGASSSSGWAAGRTSTWPRCSTPTPPTTWPRRATTCPQPPDGLPDSPLAPAAAAVGFRWG